MKKSSRNARVDDTRSNSTDISLVDSSATAVDWRVHLKVADILGLSILSGKQRPGSTLPKEMLAGHSLGISRTAYREALRTLTAKGLIQARPRIGTVVRERKHWNLWDSDVLRWAFHGRRPD